MSKGRDGMEVAEGLHDIYLNVVFTWKSNLNYNYNWYNKF
jgi:hypothetical protein